MVGAAQYQDKEIDWVLSAVVSKKKQSYIQTHFKEKFGRVLNHNQIRYIKNKYGKDPRFNSPLVNTRAPLRVTTPELEGSSEHGDGDAQEGDAACENQNEARPSMAISETQREPDDDSAKAMQSKRKRSGDEQGDALERLIKQTTKSQRLNSNSQQSDISEPKLRDYQRGTFSPRQSTSDTHLTLSHTHTHPLLTTLAYLEDRGHDSLYGEIFHGFQYPQTFSLLHSTNTDIGWTPSMPVDDNYWEAAKNNPVFTSITGGAGSSAMTQASSSPTMDQHQSTGYMMFQSPAVAQCQLSLPSSQVITQQVSQFSPIASGLSLPPCAEHQEQHQQLLQQERQFHSHMDISLASTLPEPEISNSETETYVQGLIGVAPQLIPSFQDVPIESTCPQHGTIRSNLAGMEGCQNWAHATTSFNSSPQDLSLFNFAVSPMNFPFESVRHKGLTDASSQAIRQTVANNVNMYNSSLSTQGQHHHSLQSIQQHSNFDASAFELLGIAQTPILSTTAATPYAQPSYPVNNSTMAFSPSMVQARYQSHLCHSRSASGSQIHDLHGAANDASGTIDPRLLTTTPASPHPLTSMSSSLGEAKQEKEAPSTTPSS